MKWLFAPEASMAYPFGGGFPALAHYLEWIRSLGGETLSGYAAHPKGALENVLIRLNGKTVHVIGKKQTEMIGGSYIAYLDRRLGIKSKWCDLPGYD